MKIVLSNNQAGILICLLNEEIKTLENIYKNSPKEIEEKQRIFKDIKKHKLIQQILKRGLND